MSEPEFPNEPSKAMRVAARIGISSRFAALVRIHPELILLQVRSPRDHSRAKAGVYLVGALVAAVFSLPSVVLLWFGRTRFSIAVAADTILAPLAIKLWAVRAGVLLVPHPEVGAAGNDARAASASRASNVPRGPNGVMVDVKAAPAPRRVR